VPRACEFVCLQAIALVTGRLLVMLKGDEKLSQASLPLLMDAVTMQVGAQAAHAHTHAAVCACQ